MAQQLLTNSRPKRAAAVVAQNSLVNNKRKRVDPKVVSEVATAPEKTQPIEEGNLELEQNTSNNDNVEPQMSPRPHGEKIVQLPSSEPEDMAAIGDIVTNQDYVATHSNGNLETDLEGGDDESIQGEKESDTDGEIIDADQEKNSANKNETKTSGRSWVWQYFKKNEAAQFNQCILCGLKLSYAKSKGSTTGMLSHLMSNNGPHKFPKGGPDGNLFTHKGEKISSQLLRVPYSASNLKWCTANWIVSTDQPFSSVEEQSYHQMIDCASSLEARVICAHSTITLTCEKMHSIAEKWVKGELQKVKSRLSFTVDIASSRYRMFSFLGVTAHWMDDNWDIQDIGLSLTALAGPHSGENINESFVSTVSNRFDILNKFIAFSADAATNNSSFMAELTLDCHERNLMHVGSWSRVSCFAHILNLAAKDFMKALNAREYLEPLSSEDEDQWDEGRAASRPPPKNIVKKLRSLVNVIRKSGQRRALFQKICEDLNIEHLELIIDCATRWNSSFDMLERALKMRLAIDRFVLLSSDKDVKDVKLESYEWSYLESAEELLKVFKAATEVMRSSRYPTLTHVIPFFRLLIMKLNEFLGCNLECSPDYQSLERAGKSANLIKAAEAAKTKLKKYFAFVNHPKSIHTLATMLDPRFKLEFFKLRADWSQPKLKAAKDNAHNLWQTLYKPVGHTTSTTQIGDLANGQQFVSLLWAASTAEQEHTPLNPNAEDELTRYLDLALESSTSCPDILQWWKKKSLEFPNLSKMAMDILPIPATSVPIERRFSDLTDIVTPNRANLKKTQSR